MTINDPLPSGTGISWSISPATAGCSITGAVPAQVLVCGPTTLASGADLTVHVTSATTSASCKAYDNTAKLTASNGSAADATATTTAACPVVLAVVAAPPKATPAPTPPSDVLGVVVTLPVTGTASFRLIRFAGLALILGAAALLAGGRRKRATI